MSRAPRGPLQLVHGETVIATAIAFYPPHIGNGCQSQEVGDMLFVNNPSENGHVSGYSLMPGSVGLGSSLAAGTYRRAKPSDKHYLMTAQEWDRYQPERFVRFLFNIPFTQQLLFACLITPILIGKFA